MKLGILKNEFDDNHLSWINACNKFNIEYKVIDFTSNNWVKEIKSEDYTAFLTCPSARQTLFKSLYDERLHVVNKVMGKFVYPSYEEVSVHENKKYLSYWLSANNEPHPDTNVFYSKEEAEEYINTSEYPIVAKFNIGASGKGVRVLYNKEEAKEYINQAFGSGLRQSWGPNLKMGGFKSRILKLLKNPARIIKRVKVYSMVYNEVQKGFVIFQKFIPHNYEWRVVKIGESYFGHQKIKQGEKASGTKGIDYNEPPVKLLNFVKNLCEKHNFNCMAVDLFEDGNGGYLINELQCIFGHVQSYICEKDGKPGRFVFKEDKWLFEEGMFNTNLSYDLRMENILEILK
ncbi:MAG: hypothetical protein N4A72_19465 [Bacteroidales bacterium]|jgi:glutathione synthase/RimK-type ligase-like ATP-grasp enzyme|nr:hypothetical protein [Bacteroidales bacterium]